jgi:hypothetical protein
MHWRWTEQRFGVWGVRDYYTLLEQMAREGAAFTLGYVMRTSLPRLQMKQATAARWWLNSSLARRVPRCGQRMFHSSERSLGANPKQPGPRISDKRIAAALALPQSSRACGFGR